MNMSDHVKLPETIKSASGKVFRPAHRAFLENLPGDITREIFRREREKIASDDADAEQDEKPAPQKDAVPA
jgi:hypothetical protein